MSKAKRILFIIVATVVFVAEAVLLFQRDSRVNKTVCVEAGTVIDASVFKAKTDADISIISKDIAALSGVGVHTVLVQSGLSRYQCELTVQDTTAPVAQIRDIAIRYGEKAEPSHFFTSVKDATEVSVAYVSEPDWETIGRQTVALKATDTSGNFSEYETTLLVCGAVRRLERERGNIKVTPKDFAINDTVKLSWGEVPEWDKLNSLGIHNLVIEEAGEQYEVELLVKDTVAPKIELKDISGWVGKELLPEEYVKAVEDESAVTLSFAELPDYTKEGNQKVKINATDEAGNSTERTCMLVLQPDTVPPVISGVTDKIVYIGDSVTYRSGITVTDNVDEKPKLTIDTSAVDLKTVGTYLVVYTAVDSEGNTASETMQLRIDEQKYSDASIYAMADEVLAKIITEEMTDREKLTAIYNWVHKNVRYYDYSDKKSWTKSAYQGFVDHRGDCFTYASIAQALLTRAGITNMMINRIPDTYQHFWNLVDIGEGWYHFDTCPRLNTYNFDYIGDDEILAYSIKNKRCHHYDTSLFPEVQKQ